AGRARGALLGSAGGHIGGGTRAVEPVPDCAELAAISGVERVRSSLSLIAARQDDEPGVIRTQLLRSQAEARNGAGREALDEHVGRADERSRESHTLGMLQVERRASLPVVVEGE